MLLEFFSESVGWIDEEMIKSRSHGAFVGQIPGYFTFVFSDGSTNERSVVKKSIFGCFGLLFQGSEKCLLSAKDLDGGSRILG